MKDLIYNLTWWLLFAVLIILAFDDQNNPWFFWLSGLLVGTAVMRIFERAKV